MTTRSNAASLSYTQLLRNNRPYRKLWLSQVVSNSGDWFNTIAVLGLTLDLTQSGLALSITMLCQMLPAFFVAPIAGVIAERYDRKRIMVVADLLRSGVALGFLLVDTPDEIWLIYLFMACLSALGPFFDVTRTAALPSIVRDPELLAANALSSATWGIMLTIGSGIGGLVADQFGRSTAFELNALSFIVSALIVARIALPKASGAGQPVRFFSDFLEGLRYIRMDQPTRVYLPGKAVWGLAGGAAVMLYAVFGGQIYRAGDTGIAILYTARGLGTIIGTLGMKLFSSSRLPQLRSGILIGLIGYGFWFIIFSFAPSLWLAAICIMLATCGSMVTWVFSSLGLQLVVKEDFRGRVFAADTGLFTLAFALSTLSTGLLLDTIDPRVVAFIAGVVGFISAGVWFYFVRRIPLPADT